MRINLTGTYGLAAAALMTISDDVGANYDALVAKVEKLETTEESVKAWATGIKKQVADLQTALANAGTDTTKLTAVRDGLATLASRIDAVEAAGAIIATT